MSSIFSAHRALRAAVAATVLLTACGSDTAAPQPEPSPQTFRAALTGALTRQVTGGAFFGRATDGQPGEGWALVLASTNGNDVLMLANPVGGLPTVGTYQIYAPTDPDATDGLSGFLVLPEAEDGALQVRSGRIRITRATATAIVGEIEVRARGLLAGETTAKDVVFAGPLHAVFTTTPPAAAMRNAGRSQVPGTR